MLGPAEIAERLDDRFPILTQGRAEAPARHRTLRAALEWSHDLLTGEEAILFRRLSVFAGSAGLAAVEDVCGGKGAPRDDIVDLLTALVTRSFVVADTSRARARYRMLETVRAYGRERLEEAGEARAILSRHAKWCTSTVERAWHDFAIGDPHVVVDMLEADHAHGVGHRRRPPQRRSGWRPP